MKKLLRKKDIFLLTLAGIGDALTEIRDPFCLVSSAYKKMYGFIPSQYQRHNFSLLIGQSLKTGYIERIIKNEKAYLRLTSAGRERIQREFPITSLRQTWNKKWTIVIFDIKEKSRRERNRLRKMLKNIGFGMLQQSVWITPLPIGQDVKEFIAHQGFSDNIFVLEVSHLLLGDPKILAKRIWGLDRLEGEYLSLKSEEERMVNSIKNGDGRHKKRYGGIGEIEEKLRHQKKKLLTFLVTLPPLPRELFAERLRKAIAI